ncbi:MAG: hypothetical protein JJV97_00825 [SAR324 cluster bacterium]|nr:hypothetical protein [SAR324 cluster bacterium]
MRLSNNKFSISKQTKVNVFLSKLLFSVSLLALISASTLTFAANKDGGKGKNGGQGKNGDRSTFEENSQNKSSGEGRQGRGRGQEGKGGRGSFEENSQGKYSGEGRQGGGGGQGGRGGRGSFGEDFLSDDVLKKLKITGEQESKIKELTEEFTTTMKGFRCSIRLIGESNTDLFTQDVLISKDVEEMIEGVYTNMDLMGEVTINYLEKIHALLNAEQRKDLVNLFQDMNDRSKTFDRRKARFVPMIVGRISDKFFFNDKQEKSLEEILGLVDDLDITRELSEIKQSLGEAMLAPNFPTAKLKEMWAKSLNKINSSDDLIIKSIVDLKKSLTKDQLDKIKLNAKSSDRSK